MALQVLTPLSPSGLFLWRACRSIRRREMPLANRSIIHIRVLTESSSCLLYINRTLVNVLSKLSPHTYQIRTVRLRYALVTS